MGRNYWKIVNDVIESADILLEIVDARFPDITRNEEIERKIIKAGKQYIIVMNKCDLTTQKHCEEWKTKLDNTVFISSKEHQGTKILREAILKRTRKREITIGVVGYPNVGKSSVINVLKGKASAKASSVSGFTRAVQRIKIANGMYMLDTPGVIPFKENDRAKHVLIGTVSYQKLKDPEAAAMQLIETLDGLIEGFYDVKGKDPLEVLEKIAMKKNKLIKGGEPDTGLMGRLIIKAWQEGKIREKKDIQKNKKSTDFKFTE
jgi:ribosome biogenesis GTPase A